MAPAINNSLIAGLFPDNALYYCGEELRNIIQLNSQKTTCARICFRNTLFLVLFA
jgi:hypothetical protein